MQSFQAAQQTPVPPDPFATPKPSLLQKIKAHKTPVIIAGVAVLILTSMITYLAVSPSHQTLVAPATQEPNSVILPTKKPTPTKTQTKKPTLTPTPSLVPSSWGTYNNTTYGYSIRYPSDWTVRNLGELEPLVPSYIVFNVTTASQSARSITISISTRSYDEQLALEASGSATTVAGISGMKQDFQDSDGNTSTVITLPRTSNLLVLRSKTAYLSTFNQMLTTLQTAQ